MSLRLMMLVLTRDIKMFYSKRWPPKHIAITAASMHLFKYNLYHFYFKQTHAVSQKYAVPLVRY